MEFLIKFRMELRDYVFYIYNFLLDFSPAKYRYFHIEFHEQIQINNIKKKFL